MRTVSDGMVTLPEAARMACFAAGASGVISEAALNEVALRLSQLVTLYCAAAGDCVEPRPITAEELEGAVFTGGARSVAFSDGRSAIGGLAVTSAALHAVLKLFRAGARGT
jgi:hypothetical protein